MHGYTTVQLTFKYEYITPTPNKNNAKLAFYRIIFRISYNQILFGLIGNLFD